MLKIEVSGLSGVAKMLDGVRSDLRPRVLQPAINKVAEKARAEIARALPQEFAVKAAEVRSAVDLRRASSGRVEAVLTVFGSAKRKGRSLNLIHFLAAVQMAGQAFKVRGAKATKKDLAMLDQQLGFIIKRAGGMKRLDGVFLGNKGRTIFRRVGRARLPIEPVQVIGFSQMFNSRRISQRVIDKINTEMPVEVERALRLLMERGA